MKSQSTRKNINPLQDPDFYRTQNILLFVSCLMVVVGYQVLPYVNFSVDDVIVVSQKGFAFIAEKSNLVSLSSWTTLGTVLGHMAEATAIFALVMYKKLAVQQKLILATVVAIILSVILIIVGNWGQTEAIETALKAIPTSKIAQKLQSGSQLEPSIGKAIYWVGMAIPFLLAARQFSKKDEQLLKSANRFW
ncbi:MAG: DUF4293 family protein [Bacteroidia bacterium]|nr:DUF4293 family protein [Bacteroidia bacterium]